MSAPPPARASPQHVCLGDNLLLVLNDDSPHFCVASPGSTFNVRRIDFSPASLVGAAWGSVWELSRGGRPTLVPSGQLLERIAYGEGSGVDNRHAVADAHASQALSQGVILGLKAGGASGADIVAALISNSTTFASKTAYAQEKYIKRKQLKHSVRFRVVRPSPALIAHTLGVRMPERMW